jgi:uncharacterized protein
MKLTKEQFSEIKKFAESYMCNNDIWHKSPHIIQTANLSKALARKEGADTNKCIVIAWLHDIAKYQEKEDKNHGDEGAKIAAPFLTSLDFSKTDVEDICYAIKKHNKGGPKKTIESKIIWDADKLQGVGPYGILRNYGFCISHGKNQEEAYNICLKEQNFFIKRFYTETAKKIALAKIQSLETFYSHYEDIAKAKI